MKILVVEDDINYRKSICKFLSKYGYCDVTVDGKEAIDAFLIAHDENEPYDLICMDITMPKLDGISTLKAIRNIEREIGVDEYNKTKVIMTTEIKNTNKVEQAFACGCQGYAAKPINTDKMLEVFRELELIED